MDVAQLLLELYGRIPPLAGEAVEGLDTTQLRERVTHDANPIAWLDDAQADDTENAGPVIPNSIEM